MIFEAEIVEKLFRRRLKPHHLNVSKANLEGVVKLLPSLNAPTVSPLYQSDWFAVETVVGSNVVRDLIPELLKNGAEGIIEYPLNKVV